MKDLIPAGGPAEYKLGKGLPVDRDRWDRPLIKQLDGSPPVPYRRASTVADVIESHYGLHQWELRLTAQGLAQRPDLVQSIHTTRAPSPEFNEIVDTAMDVAGKNVASRNGSTMHALTELLDRGVPIPKGLPSNIVAMLEKYQQAMERFEVLDTERFVVQDKIKVAGTYDRRVVDKLTGEIRIGDLKTGQRLEHQALKTPAQVAVYAAGQWYDDDGRREDHGADRDWGLLIWLPWSDDPRQAVCEIRSLDLRIGRKAIMEAFRVERLRTMKPSHSMPLYP